MTWVKSWLKMELFFRYRDHNDVIGTNVIVITLMSFVQPDIPSIRN